MPLLTAISNSSSVLSVFSTPSTPSSGTATTDSRLRVSGTGATDTRYECQVPLPGTVSVALVCLAMLLGNTGCEVDAARLPP